MNAIEARAILGQEEQEIFDLSEAWSKAIVANDAEAIGAFMADEWVMISERGVSTKEHFLSFVASGQLTHDSMDLAELHGITIFGDAAIMAARITNTAHFGGQIFNANEWTSDIFVRRSGEWKCVMTHITPAAQIN
ncbi:MAG: nuclear transport factor 2 family protein [Pyrinomonadaceae bacterium]